MKIPRWNLKFGHDQFLADALTFPEHELVGAYFAHVNPGYPIVEEDHFMRQYRNRDASDPPSILIAQAILLVGVHVSRQDRIEMN
jgi:transcriptional regulatory protein AMDR